MINPSTLSFFSIILSTLILISIYNNWYIFNGLIYLIIGAVLGVIYLFNRRVHSTNKKADKIVIFSISFFLVAVFSSIIYHNWKLTNLISSMSMTKIMIVLLSFLAIYLNVIYIRAEQSYKKKRGNQRIKEEPKQGYIEQFKEAFQKKDGKDKEIVLKLGVSNDNNEQ